MPAMPDRDPAHLDPLYANHPRRWRDFQYVYPVLSRRSGGLSVGVNLNIDKVCNWDCVYCQVDRDVAPPRRDVDLDQVRAELDWMLGYAASGAIWSDERFADVPDSLRRINDIAFSGDGEPTSYARFDEACQVAADLRAGHRLDDTKIIVLSNMTLCHRDTVQRGFAILDSANGEIWAKLEAGTQAYYETVDRSAVKLTRVLENIASTGAARPIVIQSLFMRLHGEAIPEAEFDAYLDRIGELSTGGCDIKLVQLYTVARHTAEAYVAALSDEELDELASRFKRRLPRLSCETYYGLHDEN